MKKNDEEKGEILFMKKWRRGKVNKVILFLLTLVLIMGGVLGFQAIFAEASNGNDNGSSDFDVDMELTYDESTNSYHIQVTVENNGNDFEGLIRIVPSYEWQYPCAYDTEITLAQGSKKQLEISIPGNVLDAADQTVIYVQIIDEKGKEIYQRKFTRAFSEYVAYVQVGILSEDYNALTYMNCGEVPIYLANNNYEIKCMELTADTVVDELANLDYLMIDRYDTASLDREVIEAIQNWVSQGGMLILGTGEYAQAVLGGFDTDFVGTECCGIYYPEEDRCEWNPNVYQYYPQYAAMVESMENSEDNIGEDAIETVEEGVDGENGEAGNDNSWNLAPIEGIMEPETTNLSSGTITPEIFYGVSPEYYIGDAALPIAYLRGFAEADGYYSYGFSFLGSAQNMNQGSIVILYHALSDASLEYYYAQEIYVEAISSSGIIPSYFHADKVEGFKLGNRMDDALYVMGGDNTKLNYTALRLLAILYVLLVGPLCYLALIWMKKREWYWFAVPALSILFVGIVSMVGRGFIIQKSTINSIVVCNAGEEQNPVAYFSAFDASHKPWQIRINDDYAIVAPATQDSWYGDSDEYYYRINYGGEGILAGISPNGSFETAHFQAIAKDPFRGTIRANNVDITSGLESGYIENHTGYDFDLMMVYRDGQAIFIRDVKDGDTVELDQVTIYETNYFPSVEDMYYSAVISHYQSEDWKEQEMADEMAALYIGLLQTDSHAGTRIVGVTSEYGNVGDGNYTEESRACFYYSY